MPDASASSMVSSSSEGSLVSKRPLSPDFKDTVTSKKKRRYKRSKEVIVKRAEKRWSRETYTVQLDSVVGSYAFGKKDGAHLREQLSVSIPSRSAGLPQAPLARRYNILAQEQINAAGQMHMNSCFRTFAKVIAPDITEQLKTLFLKMASNGLVYGDRTLVSSWSSSCTHCDQNRASNSRALHFGTWQKYGGNPQITAETTCQNQVVSSFLKEFLTLISIHIAPRLAEIFKTFYPVEWKTQDIVRQRVNKKLKNKLVDKPYLDFHGAFFAVAVKEGCSDIDHLDWGDDLDSLTFVTAVDDWEGADLQFPELGLQFPLAQGDVAAGKMRKLVHSAGKVTSGRRITLTFFTSELLTKQAMPWYKNHLKYLKSLETKRL